MGAPCAPTQYAKVQSELKTCIDRSRAKNAITNVTTNHTASSADAWLLAACEADSEQLIAVVLAEGLGVPMYDGVHVMPRSPDVADA